VRGSHESVTETVPRQRSSRPFFRPFPPPAQGHEDKVQARGSEGGESQQPFWMLGGGQATCTSPASVARYMVGFGPPRWVPERHPEQALKAIGQSTVEGSSAQHQGRGLPSGPRGRRSISSRPRSRPSDILQREENAGEEGFQRQLALFAMALSSKRRRHRAPDPCLLRLVIANPVPPAWRASVSARRGRRGHPRSGRTRRFA
jgi:hypothetical protein